MKRFFICLSVFLLLVALTPRNAVYAEEYTDPEGNVYVFRWKWTYINSNNTVRKCRVKANGENLRSSWQSYYSSAVEHWNTLGAQHNDLLLDKVYMYNVPFAQSKLDFYSATSENLSWFYDGDFQNIRGIALLIILAINGSSTLITVNLVHLQVEVFHMHVYMLKPLHIV